MVGVDRSVTTGRQINCESAQATESLGATFAGDLLPGDVILFEGDLAAGKTTMVRGLAKAFGADPEEVSSPTFVLIQTYRCGGDEIRRLHHVDLYRLEDRIPDLRELGLEELLSDPQAVIAIEWPRRAMTTWIPNDARLWRVRLTVAGDGTRCVEINGPTR